MTSDMSDKVLDRLHDFSDGIFAFAITLLVLNLVLPEATIKADLVQALLHLWPRMSAFLISFLVIGLYWILHVRQFRFIDRYTTRLIWLNLGFLFFIVLMPFTTSVLSDYFGTAAVVLYAGNLALAGYMDTALLVYAYCNGLVDERVSTQQVKRAVILNLVAPVMFTLSIGIAFIDADWAAYSWISPILVRRLAEWIFRVPKTGQDIR